MLPTSPEAAMLGKFGEIPIGYYTGTADVSIPLYTIKEAGVEIPIVLRYHGSGIKVEDEASNVGLGWSVEPGGSIIQIVNGLPEGASSNGVSDNLPVIDRTGYDYMVGHGISGMYFQRHSNGTSCWDCGNQDSGYGDSRATLDALSRGFGQPDIYQYSFPGFSGKFFINPATQLPVLLDKKSEITFIYNDPTLIIAKTLDGNKFYFDVLETTKGQTEAEYTGKTFKLSKIELNTGKVISFNYQDGFYQWFMYNETFHTDLPWGYDDGGTTVVTPHSDFAAHYIKMLTSIVSDKVIINFNLEDRQDLYTPNPQNINGAKRIASIDMIDPLLNQKIKSYNFSYDYFTSDNSTIGGNYLTRNVSNMQPYLNALTKRLKLLSVREIGYNRSQQPVINQPYSFSYNESVSLPYKTSFARDYWGFYNGLNNQKLIPDLSFFYYSDDVDYQTMPANLTHFINGANRAPDSTKMQAWVLKRVTYPTGGYSEFDYQSHNFGNHIYPDVERINAASRHVTLSDHNTATDNKSFTFSLVQTQSITFYNTIGRGTQNFSFYDLEPSTITLTKTLSGNTTIIKAWQMFVNDKTEFNTNNGFFERDESITIPYEAGAQYTVTTSLPDELGQQVNINTAQVSCQFSYYSPSGNYTSSYGGGLRISGIRNYDISGNIATRKSIKYVNTDHTTSGLLMSPMKPIYYRDLEGVKYRDDLNYDYSNVRAWFVSSESAVPYSDAAGGNIVGYSRVEETELASNGMVNGKKVYYYNNFESDSHPNVPDNPNLLNGTIKREEIFSNNSAIPQSATDYTYKTLEMASFSGVKIYNAYYGDEPHCGHGYLDGIFAGISKWQLCYYGINSYWYVLDSTKTTESFNGQLLSKKKVYNYNGIGQVIKEITTDSRNHTLTNNYIYPFDIPSYDLTPIQHLLMTKNLYNNLIEQENTDNTTSVSHARITYDNINNQLVRTKIEQAHNGNPFVTEVTFDSYGSFKAPLQVTEHGSRSSAFLWDDKYSSIIAEGTNTTAQDMAYSSFEIGQSGNWSIGSVARNTYGYSGGQSYNLLNGAVSISGLNSSYTYTVSYWTKNTMPFTIAGTISGYPRAEAVVSGWTHFVHRIAGVGSISINGSGDIDDLRLYPTNAQMTTYTYEPLVGMTSSTDNKGMTTTYEYDSFQRLLNVKDKDGNIVKHNDYHYQNQ